MTSGQQFKVQLVSTNEGVFANWPFFLEGLQRLNTLTGINEAITSETLLKTLLHAAAATDSGNGLVMIVTSKNGKPLLWGAAVNNTAMFKEKSCVVYAVYTNEKAAGVVQFAMQYFERWAKGAGYSCIQAYSPSFSGARIRLFEHVWGFRRAAILFTKPL